MRSVTTETDCGQPGPRLSDTVLEVTNLHKSYGPIVALDGIDLSVESGQIVALLGPNGAGKTTLVSIICGLRKADRGSVSVLGIDALRNPQLARSHIGLAPQEMGIYPMVTVSNNLRLFGELIGLSGSQLRAKVDEVAVALRLDGLMNRKAGQMSGGQKRRLHTAIALLNNPPLVLLDEPTTGADVETRSALLEVVCSLAARGSAVVYSTHYLQEVETLDATVVIVEHGKLVASGKVQDLIAKSARSIVTVTFDGPAPESLDGYDITVDGPSMQVTVDEPGRAAAEILAKLGSHTNKVQGIEVIRPSLESAYLSITGRRYNEEEPSHVAAS